MAVPLYSYSQDISDLLKKLAESDKETRRFITGSDLFYSAESRIKYGAPVFIGLPVRDGDKPVAIKRVMTDDIGKEREVINRLMEEQERNRLEHLLLPTNVFVDGPCTYYISELCAWNLDEFIGKELFIDERERICEEILKGLKVLHNLGIAHRDLKPSNVLLDCTGSVRITDFGISRLVTGKTITQTQKFSSACWTWKGGDATKYDKSNDIPVVACCLYYVLTGHHPFEASSPYKDDVPKLEENMRNSVYSLEHLNDEYAQYKDLLKAMIDPCNPLEPRDPCDPPAVAECLRRFQDILHDRQSPIGRLRSDDRPPASVVDEDLAEEVGDIDINQPVEEGTPAIPELVGSIFLSFQYGKLEEVKGLKAKIEEKVGLGTCWFCEDDIEVGDELFHKIVDAINRAKIMICFLSSGYAKSKSCQEELTKARSLKMPILPVYLEDVKLEDSVVGLFTGQLLHLKLYRGQPRDFEKLISSIRLYLCLPEPRLGRSRSVDSGVAGSQSLPDLKNRDPQILAGQSIPFLSLPPDVKRDIGLKLNRKALVAMYGKHFAEAIGVETATIGIYESQRFCDYMECLLEWIRINKEDYTVDDFRSLAVRLERLDIVKILDKWLSAQAVPDTNA